MHAKTRLARDNHVAARENPPQLDVPISHTFDGKRFEKSRNFCIVSCVFFNKSFASYRICTWIHCESMYGSGLDLQIIIMSFSVFTQWNVYVLFLFLIHRSCAFLNITMRNAAYAHVQRALKRSA